MPSLSLINISKSYREKKVIDNLSLEIKDREFFAILGPSGCGKTTVLKIIAGLESHEGTLLFDGVDITSRPPHQRDVSMIFQSYALYPHRNVRRNISFPLEIKKRPPGEIDKRVTKTAQAVDMNVEGMLERNPKELSGGHRQRVALGRAFVKEPKVYLLDEPLSNLDAKIRARTRAELKRLLNPPRATVVYITPDQEEAFALANRIAVMNENGRVEQVGTPRELYERPLNLFVASYLGAPPMNFFEGNIRSSLTQRGLKQAAFVTPDFQVEVPLENPGDEETYLLGIRPQNIKVEEEARPGNLKAQLESVENGFPGTILNFKMGGRRFKAKVRGTFTPEKETVCLSFPSEQVLLFRKKTGERFFP